MGLHLTVPAEISKAIGVILRGQRETVNGVLTTLRDELENRYDSHRKHRDYEDHNLFIYMLTAISTDGTWHHLQFSVDDSMATGYLLITSVDEIGKGKFPGQ